MGQLTANDLQDRLRSLGNPKDAAFLAGFFKAGPGQYGEGDVFIGVRVPAIRKAAKDFKGLPLAEDERLLHSPIHEVRLAALVILVVQAAKADARARRQIYDLYLANTRFVNNWDLVDLSAPQIIGAHLADRSRRPLYAVSMDDVRAWESRHGPVPEGAFVALRTDWSKRWPDAAAMRNADARGVAHYPGWSLPVLQYLYEERKITASGHETTDTDPGVATSKGDYSPEKYVLGTDHYQIELLANLDRVPEAGAIAVVTFPKPKGGSGFPARVFAVLP